MDVGFPSPLSRHLFAAGMGILVERQEEMRAAQYWDPSEKVLCGASSSNTN